MPVNAVILLRLKKDRIYGICFDNVRQEFARFFNLDKDDFYYDGPFQLIQSCNEGSVPVKDDKSVRVNVNLCYPYFGRDYKRGDIVFFIKCAEWLENRFPACEVWYGHDIDDENISRFGIVEQKELLEYYLE